MKDFCYRHSYHPSHKVNIRTASEPMQDALYDQVARVPGVGATVFDTGQGPVAFTGEHADTIRAAGIPVRFKYIHCTAAIRDGVQDVSTHGPVYMAIDNNGKSFDEMIDILSHSGVPFSDAKPAKGIYDGYVGDSTVITIDGSRVIDMHKYLRRNYAGFGCAAIMSDEDGTKGFDAAGYNSDADPRVSDDAPSFERQASMYYYAAANVNGAMISIDPANTKDLVMQGGEPADRLHTTVAYVSPDASQMDEAQRERLLGIGRELASRYSPKDFNGAAVKNMMQFPSQDGDKAHVAILDHPSLSDLHYDAFNLLARHGFNPSARHALKDYVPHVTVAYGDPDLRVPDLSGTPVKYKGVTVTIAGDKHFFPFARKGAAYEVATSVEEMRDTINHLGWSVVQEPAARLVGHNVEFDMVIGPPLGGDPVTVRGSSIADVYAIAIRKAQMKNNINFPRVASQMEHFHGPDAYINPDEIQLPSNHDIAPHDNPLSAEYHGRTLKPGQAFPNTRKNWMGSDMALNFNRSSLQPSPPLDTKNGEDPLNYQGLKPYLQDVHRKWWLDDPDEQRKTILNAFRVVLLSPNKDFKFNVVHFQDIADMPADSTALDYAHRLNTSRIAWNEFRSNRSGVPAKSNGTVGKIDNFADLMAREVADKFKLEYKPDDLYSTTPAHYFATDIILKWRTFVQTLLKKNAKRATSDDDDGGEQPEDLWDLERGVSHARKFGESENWMVIAMLTQRYNPDKFPQVMNSIMQPSKKRVSEVWSSIGLDKIDPFWLGDKAFEGMKFNEKAFDAHKEWTEGILHDVRHGESEGRRFSLFPSERQREEKGHKNPHDRYGGVMMGHLRQIEKISSHIEDLRLAALKDLKFYQGSGHYFRTVATQYTGPKVASFAWLLLTPHTSDLSTNDTHIGRFLTGAPDDPGGMLGDLIERDKHGKPTGKQTKNAFIESMLSHKIGYQVIEQMMKEIRDRMGYSWMPLAQFQWLIWDRVRYPNSDQQTHTQHHGIAVKDWVPHYDPTNQFETAAAFNKDGGLWTNKPNSLQSVMSARDDVLTHMFSAESPLTPKQQETLMNKMRSNGIEDWHKYLTEGSPLLDKLQPVTAAVDEDASDEDQLDQWWDDFVGPSTDMGQIGDDEEDPEREQIERDLGWHEFKPEPSDGWFETSRIENHRLLLSSDEILGLAKRVARFQHPFMGSLVRDALNAMEEFNSVESDSHYSKILENCLKVYTGDPGLAKAARVLFLEKNSDIKKGWNHSIPFLVAPDGRIVLGNTEDRNHSHIYEKYVPRNEIKNWTQTRRMTGPWSAFEQGRVHFPYEGSPYELQEPRVDFYGIPYDPDRNENVYKVDPRHAVEAASQVMRERRDAGMDVEPHPSWNRQTTMQDIMNPMIYTASEEGERSPSHRFVYYNGALDVRDYDHNLRFADMIKELLKEHGKNITDRNVEDNKIASGDIFYNSGNIDIRLESLADEDVQKNAISSIHNWAINLVGDIKPNIEKTAMPYGYEHQNFLDDLNNPDRCNLEKDPLTRFEILGDESPYWTIDPQALVRFFTNKKFPIRSKVRIWLYRGPSGLSPARGGSHLLHLNNTTSAEEANWTLLHELQHAYQFEENLFPNNVRNALPVGAPEPPYHERPHEADSDQMATMLHDAGIRLVIPRPGVPQPQRSEMNDNLPDGQLNLQQRQDLWRSL